MNWLEYAAVIAAVCLLTEGMEYEEALARDVIAATMRQSLRTVKAFRHPRMD